MQYIILALSLLCMSAMANAQCDKKVTWYASKLEATDSTGRVLDTIEDELLIIIKKDEILLQQPSDERNNLHAAIKETICNWEQPYKKGRSFYKVVFSKENGDTSPGTLAVEIKDGAIVINVFIEKVNETAHLTISKYKEEAL
ncbi:MAG: hypothetical protein QM731_14060 [Chitinophagaceae bacterium]